jgi:predicted MPP superfamily phosphohydrolase
MRALLWAVGLSIALVAAFFLWTYWQAQQPPIVQRHDLAVADWPAGVPPVDVLLVSDTHVVSPDMSPQRLAGIVAQLNGLKPDLVVLAGDYISEKAFATHRYTAEEAIAPLAGFKAPLGVVAVLGNHDHWHDQTRKVQGGQAEFRAAFAHHGISLLTNSAIRRGPLIIGGLDDGATFRDNIPRTMRAMARLGTGPRILLSHTPVVAYKLTRPVTALLAGHTHCGQMVLPEIGRSIGPLHPRSASLCGKMMINGTPVFIGAGLGTSIVPLRMGAPPDVWLVRFGPDGAKPPPQGRRR